jgi:glycosyltransferase involved in cell wall biosynthesis
MSQGYAECTSSHEAMKPDLVSCIVPVFNGERYLREALDSILAQTYPVVEIIVADDGSTDGTAALVGSYGDRVQHVWQPNAGPAAARNLGLWMAHGEFVAFLDQDDIWHPEKLIRQVGRLQARAHLSLCVTHVRLFWVSALRAEETHFRGHRITRDLPGYITGTLLARRTLFDTVGLFNPALRYGDAMDWFLRTAVHGAIIELLPDVLLHHRMHQSNLSRREAADSRHEFLQILKASLDRRRRLAETVPIPSTSTLSGGKHLTEIIHGESETGTQQTDLLSRSST